MYTIRKTTMCLDSLLRSLSLSPSHRGVALPETLRSCAGRVRTLRCGASGLRRCRHHRPRLCPVPFICEPKHAWGTLWGCVGEDIRQKVDSKHTKERRENGADAEHVRARSKQREEFSHQTAPWTSPLWTLFLIKLTLSLSPMSRTAESIQLHQIISVPCDGRFQVPLNIN